MKNLLPNLSKIPPKVSLTIIGASLLLAYLSPLRPVDSLTMDDISPGNLINGIANVGRNPEPLPVPRNAAPPVGRYSASESVSPCASPPSMQINATDTTPAPVAPQPTRTYWDAGSRVLTDPRAITLFNLAPGTRIWTVRRAVNDGGRYPNENGDSVYFETDDGKVQVNFTWASGAARRLTWVGFVQ